MIEIVHRFAEALDRDDYAVAKELLEPDAEYETSDSLTKGVDAILASFREVSEWGRANLDALEFTHRIDDTIAPTQIIFIDVLRKNGERLDLEHSMHVKLSATGRIEHLRLERPPGEKELVAAFFERHGLKRPSVATIEDFLTSLERYVLPALGKCGFTEVDRLPTPPTIGSGPSKDGTFELRATSASWVARSEAFEAAFGWEPREAVILVHIRRGDVVFGLDDLLAAANTPNPGMVCRTIALLQSRLQWLARFLSSECAPLLSGNEAEFKRFAEVAQQRTAGYNRAHIVAPAIARANDAFHAKDYRAVVTILAPFEDGLRGVASKQLDFARRHL